jgi:hypothetical protein
VRGRLIVLVLVAVGVLLLITRGPQDIKPPSTSSTPTPATAADPNAIADAIGNPVSTAVQRGLEHAARAFFSSYVRLLYGHGGRIRSAKYAVAQQLQRAGANPALRGNTATVGKIRGTKTRDGYSVVAQITDTTQPTPYALEADFVRTRAGVWLAGEFTVGE